MTHATHDTTFEGQMAMARDDPTRLLDWETSGVRIHEEAWIAGIDTRPCIYALVPHRLKTLAMSRKAMEKDALLYRKVPECFRTDAFEEAYVRARDAASATTESEKDDDFEEDRLTTSEEEEEDLLASSSSEDDEPLQRRVAAQKKKKRVIERPPPERASSSSRRRGPLGGYSARLGAARTGKMEATTDRQGIDLTVIDALEGAGQRFGKIFMVANDPGATASERARAQELVDKKLREGKHEVLEAYKTLTEGTSVSPRPGLQKVDVMQHGNPAMRQQCWMSVLATGVAVQYLVKSCAYSRPLRYGFYGDEKGSIAAAKLYVELFTFVCATASNHSWGQGFADRYCEIQKNLMRAAEAQAAPSTALVIVDKRALAERARAALGMTRMARRSAKLKGSRGDAAAYAAGRAAASVQAHAPSKKARLA